ncbi:hypothetical protein PHYSODRAFT_506860 [Phytophthora sojae]|uniref:FAD-binding FR-type domain-containing protein n=1 Tax=Phytophthora sojae (strain P6497) TaxID=1094619 RepID=G4ZLX0_PHYSP|nr:hypothetical protein PHYSODRAFT_506860 [Phytophthora sojae]EGZ15305.1 hypothetical protein PHYSODRAFT_506860 [Phytophthora sojae]|eukprot:XP_009529054.1 hypothetical protein PHYSODRAFT_506860 [Phytophthora sojae]
MAPSAVEPPTTPRFEAAFSSLKTPDNKRGINLVGEPPQLATSRASRVPIVGNLLQVFIVAAIVVYAYGQLFYFSKNYSELRATIGKWFGVPVDGNESAGSHPEMVQPTYFFIVGFLPIAASLVFLELLRHFRVCRITSRYVLSLTRVLRCKPRIFGWVARVSLGELLFLIFLVGGNIYVFEYYCGRQVEKMGVVCIYNMAFLFLPATRNCVWMEFLNISYANGIKYHRWVGVITVLTALFHCIGYYWSWIRQGEWRENALPCFDCEVGSKEGHDPWMNFFGEIALLAFLAIGLTSIPWVRRKMYNTFYSVHHLFLVGTIFAVLHYNAILAWIFPSVMLYVICRALSSSNGFSPVSVVVARSTAPAGDFKVGQFVYINVPAISKLQWHAFTIASSPRSSPDSLTILLKSLGDWTQELVQYSEDCKKDNVLPTIYVDGYYGGSLEMYDEYSTVCLVGGGIGVTPLFAILEDIVTKLHHGESIRQKVFFIFSFRELSLLEEIHPLLVKIKELDPQEQYFSLHFSLTRAPTTEQLEKTIDHGRLAGKPHASAVRYDSAKVPTPFAMSVRSGTSRVAMHTASFLVTLIVVVLVKYGNKVQAEDENLWPLQNLVEISLLMVVAFVAVFVSIALESKTRVQKSDSRRAYDVAETPQTTVSLALNTDVQTFQDLISEYNVQVGQRPNIPELMQKALEGHKELTSSDPSAVVPGNSTIGVFVSGPEEMKLAVEYAIADIGASHFDVFEEEFEL